MSTLVHSTFSVKVFIPDEDLRNTVSRIFRDEGILHEAIGSEDGFSAYEVVVLSLDSGEFKLPPNIRKQPASGRDLFLVVPPELESQASQWWESGLITDYVTTGYINRLPSAIRKHSSVYRSREFFNPIHHFEGLGRVVKSILDTNGLDGVFRVATEEIAKFLGAQRAVIVRHYPNLGYWRHEAEFRLDPQLEESAGFLIQDSKNLFGTGLSESRSFEAGEDGELVHEIIEKISTRFPGTWLLAPIHIGEEAWGTINLQRPPDGHKWSARDNSVAQMLADTLGIAIKQSRLLNQLQQDIEERTHLYHALHESENRFRAVVGSSPLPITIKDLDGRYSYVNPAGEKLYGAPEVNLIGRKIADFLPPHQALRSRETDQLVVQLGESRVFEERRDLVTGTYDLQMTKFPLFDDSNTIHSVCTIFEDITAKKTLISELQQSENRYRLIASAIPDTLIRLSVDGTCLDFFSPGNDFLPGLVSAPEGLSISEFGFPADLTEQIFQSCRAATVSGKVSSFEYPMEVAGHPKWFEIRVTSGSNGDSILIIRDVSERNEFIEQLKTRENRLRLLETAIDNAKDIVLITDTKLGDNPGQHILYVNRTFERFTGYSKEEVIGKTPRILQGPGTREETRTILREAILKWESVTVEILNYKKDGTEFWTELSIVPLLQPDGIFSHWVSVQRDITERKQTELALRQSQKMEAVGQLTSGVAHNFNNILMIISGHSQLLEKSLQPGSKESHQVSTILTAANRGAELVRQLMAYSRAGDLKPGIINIVGKVRETISLIEKVLPENLDIRVEMPNEPVWVCLDGEKFTQTLLNLAVNARDAMPEGGTLRFLGGIHLREKYDPIRKTLSSALAGCDLFRLEVIDTGIGMTPEVKERIFEPFFTTKEMGNGTGLGLASVFGFMTETRGQIQVDSIPSEGTSFKLFFPLAEVPLPLSPPPNQPAGDDDYRGFRVLLVEDEEATRNLIHEMLESVGFTVFSAANGAEGMQIVNSMARPVDLLITDWIMPKMGGRLFIDLFARDNPSIPIVVITGTPDPRVINQDTQSDIFIVPKPFFLTDLVQTISIAIDRRRKTNG
jgi:PAS domain S-box-containing protein